MCIKGKCLKRLYVYSRNSLFNFMPLCFYAMKIAWLRILYGLNDVTRLICAIAREGDILRTRKSCLRI